MNGIRWFINLSGIAISDLFNEIGAFEPVSITDIVASLKTFSIIKGLEDRVILDGSPTLLPDVRSILETLRSSVVVR